MYVVVLEGPVFTSNWLVWDHVKNMTSVHPLIFDLLVMYIQKRDVCQVSFARGTENWTSFCNSRQDWFHFLLMFKAQMPHIDVMKNILWQKNEQCIVFGCMSTLIRDSGSLKCNQVVPQEDGGTSWCLDSFFTDVLQPFICGFLGLIPHVVDIVCEPEEVCEL